MNVYVEFKKHDGPRSSPAPARSAVQAGWAGKLVSAGGFKAETSSVMVV